MAPLINIFISHAWDHTDLYDELVALLNSALGAEWHDRSISRDSAILIATGEEAIPQRQKLLRDRLDAIVTSARELDASIARIRSQLGDLAHEQEELKTYSHVDRLLQEERDRILDPGFDEKVRHLERLKKRYAGKDVDAAQREASRRTQEARLMMDSLETEKERLFREASACKSSLASLMDRVYLGTTGKQRDRAVELFPNLSLAIHNQIAASDVVLVIATPTSAYRQWLEFEYQDAFVLHKPTIGVLHPKLTKTLPPDLRAYGIEPVMWDPALISQAILRTRVS